MIISPKSVWFDEDSIWVRLNDARVIGVPLTWFPRLLNATKKELEQYTQRFWDSLGTFR